MKFEKLGNDFHGKLLLNNVPCHIAFMGKVAATVFIHV
jgi:hypothetical protein